MLYIGFDQDQLSNEYRIHAVNETKEDFMAALNDKFSMSELMDLEATSSTFRKYWFAGFETDLTPVTPGIPGIGSSPLTPEQVFEYDEDGSCATITGYDGAETDIIIPSTLGGFPVYGIAPGAFAGSNITSVFIKNGLEYVGNTAFVNCKSLRSVTFPASLNQIGAQAFFNCSALETAALDATVTNLVIGYNAFKDCTSLKFMSLPNNTDFGLGAFQGCTALEEVSIGNDVTTIPEEAFSGCSNLRNINISVDRSKLEVIGSKAFKDCTSLPSFTCPKDMTGDIGSEAFSGCTNLSYVTLRCAQLRTAAFNDCTSLEQVTFVLVVNIGERAFAGCANLNYIFFPSNLETIGQKAFQGCTKIARVEYPGTSAERDQITIYDDTIIYSNWDCFGDSSGGIGNDGELDWANYSLRGRSADSTSVEPVATFAVTRAVAEPASVTHSLEEALQNAKAKLYSLVDNTVPETEGAIIDLLDRLVANMSKASWRTLFVNYGMSPKRTYRCSACGKATLATTAAKNVYGEYLCDDCWEMYMRSSRALPEFYVGIATGKYSVELFTTVELHRINEAWGYAVMWTNSEDPIDPLCYTNAEISDFESAFEAITGIAPEDDDFTDW